MKKSIFAKIVPVIAIVLIVALVGINFTGPSLEEEGTYEAPTFGGDEATEMEDTSVVKDVAGCLGASLTGLDADSYAETLEAAGAVLRESLVKRSDTATVKFKTTDSLDGLMSKIWMEAMKHTGVPNEGDYLYYQTKSYSGSYSALKKGDTYLLTFTYKIKYYNTAAQEKEVSDKIKKDMAKMKLSGKSDYKKVKTIYDYIMKNVDYLYNGSGYTRYTAYGALIQGKAVCQGYSNLLYRMCLEAGIDCRIVRSKQLNHAWNIIKIKGKYYHADVTWDDGTGRYDYFLKGSADFKDHKNTDDDFRDKEFKAQYTLSKNKYVSK